MKEREVVFDIRRVEATELNTVVAVAARAFWNDPLSNFFLPDLLAQHRHASGYFEAVLTDAFVHGQVWAGYSDGIAVGVAAWLPPGVDAPTSGTRALVQFAHMAPVLSHSPHRRLAMRLMTEVPKHHVAQEHWYAVLLAADPLFHGKGIGSALLKVVMALSDADGRPLFLETQKEENLSYYARFGFVVVDRVQIEPDTPTMWMMQREPQNDE